LKNLSHDARPLTSVERAQLFPAFLLLEDEVPRVGR